MHFFDEEALMKNLLGVWDETRLREVAYPRMIELFEKAWEEGKIEPEDIAQVLFEALREFVNVRNISLALGVAGEIRKFSFVFTGDRDKDEEVVRILVGKMI